MYERHDGARFVRWQGHGETPGFRLRAIGAGEGGLDYAAVSVAIKRQQQRAKSDTKLTAEERAAVNMLNAEPARQ
jgi:hypothetical protein